MAAAGFDWLAVDLEHSVITLREAEELIRVIDLKGLPAFVRLSSNNSEQIKRVMDAGASGVIVPMVNTREEAVSAVSAVKYPPIGTRSFGLARAQGYGPKFEDYISWQEEGTLIIVQIEHIQAVENLESILDVPGVDGYFVGPYDLSGSLGVPGDFNHPVFLEAMDEINRLASQTNVPGGVHIVEPDVEKLREYIAKGHTFLAYSIDTRMLDESCRKGLESIADLRL
jgi:2-dehydro-3-deoxyglucarate aldolase